MFFIDLEFNKFLAGANVHVGGGKIQIFLLLFSIYYPNFFNPELPMFLFMAASFCG